MIYSLCNTTLRHILKVPSYKLKVQRNYYYALTLILLKLEQCQWIQSLHSLIAPSRNPIWMWDQNFMDLSFVLHRSIQVSIKLFTHCGLSPWLVVQTFELYTSMFITFPQNTRFVVSGVSSNPCVKRIIHSSLSCHRKCQWRFVSQKSFLFSLMFVELYHEGIVYAPLIN